MSATAPRPIFGIFEGGGAKGVAHIGALDAVNRNNLEFIGVAGASAGAIVAALVAAGIPYHEVMSPDDKHNNILARHELSPTKLLDVKDWKSFSRFRSGFERFIQSTAATGLVGGFILSPATAAGVWRIFRRRGYFSTKRVQEFLNEVLHERIKDLHAYAGNPVESVPQRIRFADLDYESFPQLRPLKIVATDTRSGSLVVFEKHTTPDVEVAEAVAASIAIPFIFEPVMVKGYDGGPFVDGGLVSNLPTWVFTEDKLAFERGNPGAPPVPIVGFTLLDDGDDAPSAPPSSFLDFLERVARTSIFGSQQVSQKFIEDLLVVPLRTKLSLLDFDATWPQIRDAYSEGRRYAAERLKVALSIKPDLVRSELGRVVDHLKEQVNDRRKAAGLPEIQHMRANLVERFGSSSFRVMHGFNMDKDADDRLLLDSRGQGAPLAFREKTITFLRLKPADAGQDFGYMTKYEQALIRPTLVSAICVPIFPDVNVWEQAASQRPEPLGIFCIDSDQDLENEFQSSQIKESLATWSVTLSPVINKR